MFICYMQVLVQHNVQTGVPFVPPVGVFKNLTRYNWRAVESLPPSIPLPGLPPPLPSSLEVPRPNNRVRATHSFVHV